MISLFPTQVLNWDELLPEVRAACQAGSIAVSEAILAADHPVVPAKASPCPNPDKMVQFACGDKASCFEPCGDLGHDERHVEVAPDDSTLESAVARMLGLKPLNEPDQKTVDAFFSWWGLR